MALINHATRELTAKVVYYGPGLCGKTTNLNYIYDLVDEDQRGPMLSLATETDRTLFFDFLPLDLGSVRGFRIRLQLYTVPGQVFYEETRKRVLKGADGVVFVADSQRSMGEANREAFRQLHQHLGENGLDPDAVPMVLQYNKRDLADIFTLDELDRDLNPSNAPIFEGIASEGIGVEDTLRAISRLVLKNLVAASTGEAEAAVAPEPRRMPPPPPPPPRAEASPFGDPVGDLLATPAGGADEPFAWAEPADEAASLLEGDGGALDGLLGGPPGRPLQEVARPAAVQAQPADAVAAPSAPPTFAVGSVGELRLEPGRPLEITVLVAGKRYRLRLQMDPEP